MACPAPHRHDGVHEELQATAARLAAHLAPRTGAYHEIWLNGNRSTVQRTNGEPSPPGRRADLRQGLPAAQVQDRPGACRKTTASTFTPRTSACWPSSRTARIVGYNVLVGGGMGMTHGNANTFPYLAKPICYVPAGRRGARRRGGRQAVPRPRQPRRPQARPHQVRRPRLGRRAVPRGAGRLPRRHCPPCRGRSRSAASTCTSAGIRRATANGTTA